jgi:hypothetical protein
MEQMIIEWAKQMVENFSWLTVKVEQSDMFGTFLVDFIYSSEHSDDDEFNREVLAFEEKMTIDYGDNVPLFTDNGELFTVSAAATVIAKNTETFPGLFFDTNFGILSQFLPNWLESVTYNQAGTIETEIAVDNYSEANLKAA